MKNSLLIFILFICLTGFSQDTTGYIIYPDGGRKFQVNTNNDTVLYTYYTKNSLESIQYKEPDTELIRYIRYYRNGKTMWNKLLSGNLENGNCKFYNNQGIRVAEFVYQDGKITDTVFLKNKTHLLFGKIYSSSIVYGGMYRGDENVVKEPYVTSYARLTMKLVKLDSTIENKKQKEFLFTTDYQGDFIVVLTSGRFGLFNKDYPLNEIYKGQFCPNPKSGMSWTSAWDLKGPVIIEEKLSIHNVVFKYSSVGYAP